MIQILANSFMIAAQTRPDPDHQPNRRENRQTPDRFVRLKLDGVRVKN